MNPEWIYYILMAVAALIGWLAKTKLQGPAPNAPATPSPLPGDHPLLNLILAKAQDQIRQAIHDALDKAMQDLVKPPPKA
jgi:hypothetical protein